MYGSLHLQKGVLYVGRHAKTAVVASYDLDGHALETSFSFRDDETGRSSVAGLSVDDDHRIWVADEAGARLRAFSLFGQQVAEVGGDPESLADRAGAIGVPVDVVATGCEDSLEILVASAGVRRHALQILWPETGKSESLRPHGDPRGVFRDVRRVARAGSLIYACERRARRVQVFRDLDFHFSFQLEDGRGNALEPSGLAALSDGRAVVAVQAPESALLVVDSSGRLLSVLASGAPAADGPPPPGHVAHPSGVVVEEKGSDRESRVAVIDCDGERVQVFNLDGVCYGSFTDLASA